MLLGGFERETAGDRFAEEGAGPRARKSHESGESGRSGGAISALDQTGI